MIEENEYMKQHVKRWVEKRQFFDHMQKLINSGIGVSAHSFHGWIDQYDRMLRYKQRAIQSRDEESMDHCIAFFQACYHLRDWIKNFEGIKDEDWWVMWDRFIENNIEMKYCRDISNGSKHLKISQPSIDKRFSIVREFEDDGSDYGKFLGWTLHAGGERIDLFLLMERCIEAWDRFIREDVIKYIVD